MNKLKATKWRLLELTARGWELNVRTYRWFRPDSLTHCFRVAGQAVVSARLSGPLLPSRRPAVRAAPDWRGRVVGLPSGACLACGRFATDVASPGAGGLSGPRCGSLPTVYASGIMFPRLTRVTVRQVDCLGTRSCIANRPGRARAASTSRLSRGKASGSSFARHSSDTLTRLTPDSE